MLVLAIPVIAMVHEFVIEGLTCRRGGDILEE
jgi:hypothetical protein